MPWVKLDDGFDEHHAIAPLSGEAVKLLVFSMTYCGRNLTDGFVPTFKARTLSATASPKHITELVTAGRWEEVDGGYMVRSFLEFNPSREKVLADRAASAERVKRHRNARSNAVTDTVTNDVTNGEVIRSRPDPTRLPTSVVTAKPVDNGTRRGRSPDPPRGDLASIARNATPPCPLCDGTLWITTGDPGTDGYHVTRCHACNGG